MEKTNDTQRIHVDSEVGRLRRVIIHSPDKGLGKIIPTKAQDWLFEDIVHLETMRKKEYDYYVKTLLYFLDPGKIKGKLQEIDDPKNNRAFYKPSHPDYFNSDKVVDPEFLLSQILDSKEIKDRLVAAVCAHERVSYAIQTQLHALPPSDLAITLITGILPDGKMIFGPVPNFIFTRDIGITINKHIMLTRPAKQARTREGILTKFILFNHPHFAEYRNNIIEITDLDEFFLLDDEEKPFKAVTVEGGDVMTVAPNHLLIGCSERTTIHAINQVIHELFERNVVDKVTMVKIPKRRAYMHIDTTFTQVKKNMWVIFGPFSRYGKEMDRRELLEGLGHPPETIKLELVQFEKGKEGNPRKFESLEDLLDDISQKDLKSTEPTEFIWSGGGEFPYGQREQWTDSCNVLAVKEGVVIGYDRNDKTAEAFQEKGFDIIRAEDLIQKFENDEIQPEEVENTLILLPSGELSRARGGSHCISMPILRDRIL
ncbi:arginine deiminase family protein [Rapidithrix thailandica]|uniref:arginine deiminase n=1 Tax=Rapidithrix thailandica TaxID=413964 RepID=A0AAW9S4S4_9BACT